MPSKEGLEAYAGDFCPYCGARLVFDSFTHAYVCPVCGVVYEFEMMPSYTQLSHVAPLDNKVSGKLDADIVEKAVMLFGESVALELKKIRNKTEAKEVLKVLESMAKKREYTASWRVIRKATEIASKYRLVDLSSIREQRVKSEIKRFITDNKIPVDPEDVWVFAVSHKNLWAGRKATTIAMVFTYIYCKRRGIKIGKVKPRIEKLANMLEKVIP